MSPKDKTNPKGLRISQLAKLAGVSIPTIKHYLKEGLLPRPVKTGRTMSYYDRECVDIVRQIKRLQTEKYLPLSVIKRIIDDAGAGEEDMVLGESIAGVFGGLAEGSVISRGEIARRTGYSLAKIDTLEEKGIIYPRITAGKVEYDFIDSQIVSLVREREEAGITFDYSVKMFSVFRRHIKGIVKEEAGLFLNKLLKETDIEKVLKNTIEGDRALVQFMPLIRTKLTMANTKGIIDRVNQAPDLIREAFDFTLSSEKRGSFWRGKDEYDGEAPILKILNSALKDEGMDEPKRGKNLPLVFEKDSDRLLNGVSALMEGDGEKAETLFGGLDIPSRFISLKSALLGLSSVLKTSYASGPLKMIDETRKAVNHLSASIGKSGNERVDLIISYMRGVGLSLIPNVLNVHDRAEKDLKSLISHKGDIDGGDDPSESTFFEELSLKSLYFLALMQIADDDLEKAVETIRMLKERGRKYGKKAEELSRDVGKMIERDR